MSSNVPIDVHERFDAERLYHKLRNSESFVLKHDTQSYIHQNKIYAVDHVADGSDCIPSISLTRNGHFTSCDSLMSPALTNEPSSSSTS